MSQAAEAHDAWADVPDPPPRRRREAVSWASAEELEVLGGIGEERVADWTVLTLERAEPAADEPDDVAGHRFERVREAPQPERFERPREEPSRRTAPPRAEAQAVRLEPPAPAPEPAKRQRERDPWLAIAPPPDRLPGQRRTVVIRGQVAPRPLAAAERRRPSRRPRDRVGHRPDRVALWAFVLGLLLIAIAIITAGASG